jgi:hypothetical protein
MSGQPDYTVRAAGGGVGVGNFMIRRASNHLDTVTSAPVSPTTKNNTTLAIVHVVAAEPTRARHLPRLDPGARGPGEPARRPLIECSSATGRKPAHWPPVPLEAPDDALSPAYSGTPNNARRCRCRVPSERATSGLPCDLGTVAALPFAGRTTAQHRPVVSQCDSPSRVCASYARAMRSR